MSIVEFPEKNTKHEHEMAEQHAKDAEALGLPACRDPKCPAYGTGHSHGDKTDTYTRADLKALAAYLLKRYIVLHHETPAALIEAWEKERAALQKKAQ